MTVTSSSAEDAIVERAYDDEERTVLLRYLRLSTGDEFQLAAVEAPTPAVRKALLSWLQARASDRPLVEVSLKRLSGSAVLDGILAGLPPAAKRSPRAVLVLTDLEEVPGAATESHPSLFMRLNLERDLLVRGLAMSCLLVAHPAALLKLRSVAPDFCHYFSTLVRQRPLEDATRAVSAGGAMRLEMTPSAGLELSDSDWPTLLLAADHALAQGRYGRTRDHLAEFRATTEAIAWRAEVTLLEGALEGATRGAHAGLATLATIDANESALRPATVVRLLLKRCEFENTRGERAASDANLAEATRAAERSGRSDLLAAVLVMRASRVATRGEITEAVALMKQARLAYQLSGRAREAWDAEFRVANLLQSQGEWDASIASCEHDLVPAARDILHDDRLVALANELRARVLAEHGDLDEALRIRREEELPVFEKLGDVRSRAATLGMIADVLRLRGDLDEALRVRREEELPVFEKLGDVRARAVTLAKIADVLAERGDLDEALRIRRDEVLPVFEKLGDVRERAVALGRIADALHARGDLDEALRIRREEEVPVFERLGLRLEAAIAHGNIGVLLSQQRRHRAAFAHLERSRTALDQLGVLREQIEVRLALADAHWAAGNHPGALRESQAALSRAEAQREPAYLHRAADNMISLLIALRRIPEAREVHARVETLLAEDGRWDALKKLDTLKEKIDRAAAPPQRILPPKRRR